MIVQLPEAAKRLTGALKEFFILTLHFQNDSDNNLDDDWLDEQSVPGYGVPSLERWVLK